MRTRAARAGIAVCVAVALMSPLAVGTSLAYAGPVPKCHGLVATIVGTQRDDHLMGTPRSDVILGLGGHDLIRAGGGADVVCGGADSDRIVGGPGNDRLYGERNADSRTEQLDGGPGKDLLDLGEVRSGHDRFSFASAPRDVTVDLRRHRARGEGHDRLVFPAADRRRTWITVVGSPHDDVIRGTAGREQLFGGFGDDRLYGRGGHDALKGDFGRVKLSRGHRFHDLLDGGAGPDALNASHGADQLVGGPGNDLVTVMGSFASTVHGGRGDDTVSVYPPNVDAVLDGGEGADQLLVWLGDPPSGLTYPTFEIEQASGSAVLADSAGGTWGERFVGFTRFQLAGSTAWSFHGDAESTTLLMADWMPWNGGSLMAQMGPGDDSVKGTENHDVLDGGDGDDSVSPSGGADDCTNFETGICS